MDEQLIDKVLAKKATPKEARLVAEWFATDDGQRYLSKRMDMKDRFADENSDDIPEFIPFSPSNVLLNNKRALAKRNRIKIMAAALIPTVVLLSTLGFVISRTTLVTDPENQWAQINVPLGQKLHLLLQDGTDIQLNSGSQLRYPKAFGLFNRNVFLSGEAFFNVAHDAYRPFIISLTNQCSVKVTGTQFNLKAYPDDDDLTLTLIRGNVILTDSTKTNHPLHAGQIAHYLKQSATCSIVSVSDRDQNTEWRTNSMNFEQSPLKEIIKTLHRQYNVNFTTENEALLRVNFTFSANDIPLSEVLTQLEKVSRIRFQKTETNAYRITEIK